MRLAALALVSATACTTPSDGDAEVTLGRRSWTTGAVFPDVSGYGAVSIVLAPEANADDCGWRADDAVEISLPVDSRNPHVLPGFDLAGQFGDVYFLHDDLRVTRATSGRVTPTRTVWTFNPATTRADQLEAIDGTFDVVLDDGRPLSGTFAAVACTTHY